MEVPIASRAPISALRDEETFLQVAQQAKALLLRLSELRSKKSRYEQSMLRQVALFLQMLEELAATNPRVADMWRKTRAELEPLLSGGFQELQALRAKQGGAPC